MSIATTVFENGRWVTRSQDPYQILARNRARNEVTCQPIVKHRQVPEYALLTKTLLRTPVHKWIFPAKIRNSGGKDVVFITEDSIRIDEVSEDQVPTTILAQYSFDVPIRNAHVLGRQPALNKIKRESQTTVDSASIPDSARVLGREISGSPGVTAQLPPQLLVFILANARIAFVFAAPGPDHNIRCEISQRPLPVSDRRTHRFDAHLAVDPRSRAMAIGALERDFYLYALKSREQLENEFSKGQLIDPIEAERSFTVDGIILNLEFLHCQDDGEDLVILLLLVSKCGKSRLVWFEWDTKVPLKNAQITPKSLCLPDEDSLPLFIIPLEVNNAFILANRYNLVLYKSLLAGTPSRFPINIGDQHAATEPSISKAQLLWTQWARAVRYRTNPQATMYADDNIYLCREDGHIFFLDIRNDLEHMVESHHYAGRLDWSVNRAFAVIDMGERSVDLLVVGGDTGPGGYWQFSPRVPAKQLSIIDNWSFNSDSLLTRETWFKRAHGLAEGRPLGNQLFACAGRAISGRITGLTFGCTAQTIDSIVIQHAFESTVLDVWTLLPAESHCWVLLSHPSHSSLLQIRKDGEPELYQDHNGLRLDLRTLAAKGLSGEQICQVTADLLLWFSNPWNIETQSLWQCDLRARGFQVLAASIEEIHAVPYLALAVLEASKYILFVGHLEAREDIFHEAIYLISYPTCIALWSARELPICVIGYDNGTVEIFALGSVDSCGFCSVCTWSFASANQICDSLVVVNDECVPSDEILLVCGLRNGQIHTLSLVVGSWDLSLLEEIGVGNTTMSIKASSSMPGHVIIHCDRMLYHLQYRSKIGSKHVGLLRPIDFVGTAGTDIIAFASPLNNQMPLSTHGPCLVTVGPDKLSFVEVGIAQSSLPYEVGLSLQSYHVAGTPKKILYSNYLQRYVILSHSTEVLRRPSSNARGRAAKRTLQARLSFLDREKNLEDQDDWQRDSHTLTTKPGERVLGFIEWLPRINDLEFHIFVFNTVVKDAQRPSSGRLHFYVLSKAEEGLRKLVLKKTIDVAGPVYALVPYGNDTSLIYSSGNDLSMLTIDTLATNFKCSITCKVSMRSPGRHVTVRKPDIYVSNSNESLQIYRYEDQRFSHVHGDSVSRNGLFHVTLPDLRIVVATDMCGGITGLWCSPSEQANKALATVFEASMPRAITRIFTVDRPADGHDRLIPGGPIVLQNSSYDKMEADGSGSPQASDLPILDHRRRALIGVSTDGTIYQMMILAKGWRLLRFVQNMCERHPLICPASTQRNYEHLEPPKYGPRHVHINGDVLDRLLQLGNVPMLGEMLNSPVQSMGPIMQAVDFDTISVRRGRFLELAEEVLGEAFCREATLEQVLQEVFRWLSFVLRSAL